tara:strand:- start:1853 stop:2014 length:162 start_codon:yes stop_codon:yes gene_type:complete
MKCNDISTIGYNFEFDHFRYSAYFLWNWIILDLFQLPEIGLLQMTGLMKLTDD